MDKADKDEKWMKLNENLEKLQKLEQQNEELQDQLKSTQGATRILDELTSKGKIHFSSKGDVYVPGIDKIPDEEKQE